jgi:hypothetical protein
MFINEKKIIKCLPKYCFIVRIYGKDEVSSTIEPRFILRNN